MAIVSAPNVTAFTFLKGLVAAGDTEPNPGTVNRTDLWKEFAEGKIGMINGSPALIPIIQSAGVLQSSDWTSVPIAGKAGPLTDTLGVCDNVAAFKPNGHEAQIKEFLDFAYQDQYQLAFDKEYDLQIPLEDLFLWGSNGWSPAGLTSLMDVGPSQINGTTCEQYAGRQKDLDWQIWIQAGPQPTPCKLVITYKTIPSQPHFMADFTDWDFDPRIAAPVFTPTLPPDAQKIPFATVSAAK